MEQRRRSTRGFISKEDDVRTQALRGSTSELEHGEVSLDPRPRSGGLVIRSAIRAGGIVVLGWSTLRSLS